MLRVAHSRRTCHALVVSARHSHSASREAINERVNALVHLLPSERLPTAGHADFTVAVKDNICTADMPTTCSSAMLQGFTSPFDATVVKLLKQGGASIVGKANCDEFGMGSMNVHSIHGPVVNPFDLDARRSAGGSSGGSAAAVAAGLCDVALGTDTGGSIRLPASYCGVVGFKPSYGLVSRWGVVSYADSLDCVGILARTTAQVKQAWNIINHFDEKDPTAATPETRERARTVSTNRMAEWTATKELPLSGVKVGIPQEYFPSELSPQVIKPFRSLLTRLQASGATLVPVSLPSTPHALSAYYVLASAEASSCLARYDSVQYGLRVSPPPGADMRRTADVYAYTRSAGFGAEVRKRILLGTYALTADAFDNYFLKAQRLRARIRTDFDRVFALQNVLSTSSRPSNADEVDVLLHPSAICTAPSLPPLLGTTEVEATGDVEQRTDGPTSGLDAYVQDVLTVPASLAGLPAMSVPAGKGEDGWPVGVSIVSQWGCDEVVHAIGGLVEEAARS